MKALDQWPGWQRAVFWNVCAAVGVYIGFATTSEPKVSTNVRVHIAVFTIAFLDLMFLSVRPRLMSEKVAGKATPNPWAVLYRVLVERPYVIALVMLQLHAVSRATATTIVFMQTANSSYVRELQNAQAMNLRLMLASVLMAMVAILWVFSVIGLWRSRRWAWWLALVLNCVAATVTVALQLIKHDEFLLDPLAIIAVALLLLRPVRAEFRIGGTAVGRAEDALPG